MAHSDQFTYQIQKIQNKGGELSREGMLEDVRRSFFMYLGDLPEELKYDLYEYYLDRFENNPDPSLAFTELATSFRAIIELFNLDYDDVEDALSEEEWEYLRDAISDYALDIDEETLNYVMKLIVAKGGFST
jgi:hypothetical protein